MESPVKVASCDARISFSQADIVKIKVMLNNDKEGIYNRRWGVILDVPLDLFHQIAEGGQIPTMTVKPRWE